MLEGTEINDLKNVKIIYVGLKGYHTQYKIENLDLLEEYRKSNVMTKKDMAKVIGISLRLYESISYGKNISTRCAKKLKEFLNHAWNNYRNRDSSMDFLLCNKLKVKIVANVIKNLNIKTLHQFLNIVLGDVFKM